MSNERLSPPPAGEDAVCAEAVLTREPAWQNGDRALKETMLVDYFAGDTEKVPRGYWDDLEAWKRGRGDDFHTGLLQILTRKYFGPEDARKLWSDIRLHKYYLSEKLGRNVGVKVAALDYLDNQSGRIKDLKFLPEHELNCLLLFVNEDGLTGLFNHRYFHEQLREEWMRCQRYHRIFSLMLLDLDHFKSYNDTLGHRRGDLLLREVAQYFKTTSREADTVARYGGDEFAFILPETNSHEALAFAQRLRRGFDAARFGRALGHEQAITVSVGIATYPADAAAVEDIIESADQALYRAKRAGRNCVRQGRRKPGR